MTPDEVRSLEEAALWALKPGAPREAKILFKELARQGVDHTGKEGWLYEPLPEDRPHPCVELNLAKIPVAWITYEDQYGFELAGTSVYGDGSVTTIKFCPFCGKELIPPADSSGK